MHVYFSGIGGTGIGPLALIAKQAGFDVSGSDRQDSQYIHYLGNQGITNVHIGQTYEGIQKVHDTEPIDWFVFSSALSIENPDAPELRFCDEKGIKKSKRDEFINMVLGQKNLELIAIAGTHGKTTTTAMAIWGLKQLGVPLSYSVGAKISFGDMGHYEPDSKYFVYEADEFDRNFLAFHPQMSLISGVDWDHADIYPTRDDYNTAFRDFLNQGDQTILWQDDLERLGTLNKPHLRIIDKSDPRIAQLTLAGLVNRQDAFLVATGIAELTDKPVEEVCELMNKFPGVSRRFEQIAPGLYSDYAHTPPKIRGALQLAQEVAHGKVVVIYEGLHNTRQHFIKTEFEHLFDGVDKLYIVPSYLAREDESLQLLTPDDLRNLLSEQAKAKAESATLGHSLKSAIQHHLAQNDLVLCLSAGGGHSLDEWLRQEFVS